MERNVLLSQREEARRLRLDLSQFSMVPEKLRMVRPLLSSLFLSGLGLTDLIGWMDEKVQKTMARIKQVLSERRHAALEAGKILRARGMVREAEGVEREARNLGEQL